MTLRLPKPTIKLLALTHKDSHDSDYWQEHLFRPSVVVCQVRCCLCIICFSEMMAIAEQWERDYDSMVEDLRRSSERFLGFDIYEEWYKKTQGFTPL